MIEDFAVGVLKACRDRAVTVAEIARVSDQPVGVVRELAAQLAELGLRVLVHAAAATSPPITST